MFRSKEQEVTGLASCSWQQQQKERRFLLNGWVLSCPVRFLGPSFAFLTFFQKQQAQSCSTSHPFLCLSSPSFTLSFKSFSPPVPDVALRIAAVHHACQSYGICKFFLSRRKTIMKRLSFHLPNCKACVPILALLKSNYHATRFASYVVPFVCHTCELGICKLLWLVYAQF